MLPEPLVAGIHGPSDEPEMRRVAGLLGQRASRWRRSDPVLRSGKCADLLSRRGIQYRHSEDKHMVAVERRPPCRVAEGVGHSSPAEVAMQLIDRICLLTSSSNGTGRVYQWWPASLQPSVPPPLFLAYVQKHDGLVAFISAA